MLWYEIFALDRVQGEERMIQVILETNQRFVYFHVFFMIVQVYILFGTDPVRVPGIVRVFHIISLLSTLGGKRLCALFMEGRPLVAPCLFSSCLSRSRNASAAWYFAYRSRRCLLLSC